MTMCYPHDYYPDADENVRTGASPDDHIVDTPFGGVHLAGDLPGGAPPVGNPITGGDPYAEGDPYA